MLYTLLYPLSTEIAALSWLNVLRYTSTRIIAATLTALILSVMVAIGLGLLRAKPRPEAPPASGPTTPRQLGGAALPGGTRQGLARGDVDHDAQSAGHIPAPSRRRPLGAHGPSGRTCKIGVLS